MMTLAETQQAIDTEFVGFEALMNSRQAAFFAGYGRYFQGLPLTSGVPADGERLPIDQGGAMPTDQPVPWPVEELPPTLPAQIAINVYESSAGHGYTVLMRHMWAGTTWRRTIDYSPTGTINGVWQTEAEVIV